MKAALIDCHGSADVLRYKDIEQPICTPDKIKIQIKASSINHLDIWVRKGMSGTKTPFPLVLGSDGSGIVTEVGSNVASVSIGDKVVIQPGTYNHDCPKVKNGQENFSTTYGILGETENGVHTDLESRFEACYTQ